MRTRRTNAIASLWGFAEATVFFIVPDVLLSWYALSSYKRGLTACFFALAGALGGGIFTWLWGQADPDAGRALFASLPGINEAMIVKVQTQLQDMGLAALFVGPTIGIPYKLYALEVSSLGYGMFVFLLISIPARLIRFVTVTLVIGALGQLLRRRFSLRIVQIIHVACWFAFYLWYFQAIAAQ